MCVPIFDASDVHRYAFGTPRRVAYTIRCAPDDGVDETCPRNFFTTCTVISGTTHVLEKRVPDPSGLRTAEGRRRDRDLKLLVSPSDPTCIYIRPYDPTTIYAYDPTT